LGETQGKNLLGHICHTAGTNGGSGLYLPGKTALFPQPHPTETQGRSGAGGGKMETTDPITLCLKLASLQLVFLREEALLAEEVRIGLPLLK
jgi:hypothetical protein